ncbi:hypothetical protein QBC35DRAFT_149734 [Podospora australis]|uniref:Uncharacterized protein n=1 Tax=Podospora australis TaxID=1536484 RepID=A0AAN6WXF3_9PEZI|nr:hypothetical protein QBC35DRAFT_149734 [Podospora australis]
MCDMRRRLTYSMSCGHSFLVFTERCQYDCKDPLIEDHEDAIQGEAPCAKCVADIKVKGMRQAYDMERLGKEAELQQLHKLLVTLREKDPEVRCSAQIAEIELKLELMRSSIDQESRKHNREIIEAKRAGRAAVQPQEFQVYVSLVDWPLEPMHELTDNDGTGSRESQSRSLNTSPAHLPMSGTPSLLILPSLHHTPVLHGAQKQTGAGPPRLEAFPRTRTATKHLPTTAIMRMTTQLPRTGCLGSAVGDPEYPRNRDARYTTR